VLENQYRDSLHSCIIAWLYLIEQWLSCHYPAWRSLRIISP
jgi:hypothetical protein